VSIFPRAVLILALTSGVGAQQATPPPKPADPKPPATQGTAPAGGAAVKPGSIDLTVTNLSGLFLADASVRADGPSSRQGSTNSEGDVVLTNVAPGTYRVRIQHDGFFTLEKEIVVRASARTTTEAALSPAPPPPPPAPTPAVAPTAPTLTAGSPVMISLVDQLADELLKSKDPIAEHALGCSGASAAKLVRVRDALPAHTHADADEMVYVLAGDATLTMNGKDQMIGAGWFSIIPRGTSHAVKVRGNKPLLVLSVQSGPACTAGTRAGSQ
jgi:mannose-6-phosphate isomerase-like protein (cupin superfamily)